MMVALAGVRGQYTASCGREAARSQHTPWRRDQHRGQKRGDGISYSGYKHQKGEKVIAIIDNNGYVLAPVPVAPVNETDMVLLPDSLKAVEEGGQRGRAGPQRCLSQFSMAALILPTIASAFSMPVMIPNIKENPRNRKGTKRGRKRLFNAAIHALRMRVERTFAWEDKSSGCCSDLNASRSGTMA